MNQPDTEIEVDNITLESSQVILSISKNLGPQQVLRFEWSIPTSFISHIKRERQKRAIITDAICFAQKIIFVSTTSLLFEKHFIAIYPILVIKEHHDSYLCYYQDKICIKISGVHFTVVFNPRKNV